MMRGFFSIIMDSLSKAVQWTNDQPKAEPVQASRAEAPPQGKTSTKEAELAVSVQPLSGADSKDAAASTDILNRDAEPSNPENLNDRNLGVEPEAPVALAESHIVESDAKSGATIMIDEQTADVTESRAKVPGKVKQRREPGDLLAKQTTDQLKKRRTQNGRTSARSIAGGSGKS